MANNRKRSASEVAAAEEDACKKAKKRQEEDAKLGEEVIKTVRRSFYDDARQTSVIYDVWATVLCGNTFSKCMADASTMSSPAEARERAIRVIKSEYIDGADAVPAEAKQFLTHLIDTRLSATAAAASGRIEVDMLTGLAAPVAAAAGEWATAAPQTQMVFVCKYTGATLGKTGEGFAFADVVGDSAVVKDQWGCLLNFLRAHVALFAKSKFFDGKRNTMRCKAQAEIDHAVQCVKTQLAANIEAHYGAAAAAAALLLEGMQAKREQLRVPDAVDVASAAHSAAAEKLRLHDSKFEHLLSIDVDDEDIMVEMRGLLNVCKQKRTALTIDRERALDEYNDAKLAAADVVDEIARLDASIIAATDLHKRKLDGRMVDAMVEAIATDFIEKQYYQPFRDLLYLFDNPKALPSLLVQLKRICSAEVVRTEACFAFVIGINKHFSR
jgi:hypothetical protein